MENRVNKLNVNSSNTNDTIKIIGYPHTKSIDVNKDTWFYFENIKSTGKLYTFGKENVLKNDVAVLEFDKYGVLKNKKIYKKKDLKNLNFNTKETENVMTQKSFVEKFLSSLKSKMYGK